MNEAELELALSKLALPGSAEAVERCIERSRHGVASRVTPRRTGLWPRWRLAIAVAVAVCVAAVAVTPPGRAVAEWLADLVDPGKVGDPAKVGEPPTLRGMDRIFPRQQERKRPTPTVVAAGETPRGEAFELVISGSKFGTCYSVDFPAEGEPTGAGCAEQFGRGPVSGAIEIRALADGVLGLVRQDVAAVRLFFEDEDGETVEVEAVTEQLPARVLKELNAKEPFGVFIGFIPGHAYDGLITAVAYDQDGNQIGEYRWAPVLDEPTADALLAMPPELAEQLAELSPEDRLRELVRYLDQQEGVDVEKYLEQQHGLDVEDISGGWTAYGPINDREGPFWWGDW